MGKDVRRLGRGLNSLINTTIPPDTNVPTQSEANQPSPPPPGQPTGSVRIAIEKQDDDQDKNRTRENRSDESIYDRHKNVQIDHWPARRLTSTDAPSSPPTTLPIDRLSPNRRQPRRSFDADAIAGLAKSVTQQGIVQPLVVRPVPNVDGTQHIEEYEIVAGERRWRAGRAAGLTEVPVIIRQLSDQDALELAMIENIQREDLNAIDRAHAYQAYCEEFGLGVEEVAGRLGEDRTTVTNYLRLLELPEPVKELVASGQLGMGHARAILGVGSEAGRVKLAQTTVAKGLSVRSVESLVRLHKAGTAVEPSEKPSIARPAHVRALETQLQQSTGTKVTIQEGRRKGRGKIIIEYYSLDDFDRIAAMLGLTEQL
jgi:ParB family chromosome partitioning protein